ncbi:putative Phospholipase B [Paratrimastix pyriformis]|uniref:Phospholipase B-like n=1 Tax=Paratrimastix pyriformis TaxID=342808 RepID=A0ABQ8UKY2_9EUKA|nr:putative Phospholipase B [Paratrimastix pyriformis]
MKAALTVLWFSGLISLSIAAVFEGSLYMEEGTFVFRRGVSDPAAVGRGRFDDSIQTQGCGSLDVETSPLYDDLAQMVAAGYLEGALTQHRIYQHFQNFWSLLKFDVRPPKPEVLAFLATHWAWVRENVNRRSAEDSYWANVGFTMAQIDGLFRGYNAVAPPAEALTEDQLLLLQSLGDLIEVCDRFGRNSSTSPHCDAECAAKWRLGSSCTAIVKPLGDRSDILISHNLWATLESMLRIFKHYHIPLRHPSVQATRVSFSSHPGFVYSLDDFYILDSGLVVLETSNLLLNSSLLELIQPQVVLTWVRATVANRMAATGPAWAFVFRQYNSGTYNNQWIVTDRKLFQAGRAQLAPNTVYLVEPIPGEVAEEDVTPVVQTQGYFPSYNIPYTPRIYERAGYTDARELNGDEFSYTLCPRAKMIRRDQGELTSVERLQRYMRYNRYQTDPLSLEPPEDMAATDAKVTSALLAESFITYGVVGPTWDDQPVFCWSNSTLAGHSHQGQPDCLRFDYVRLAPHF